MAKDANYIKLINTARWKRVRLKKLQAQPLCECCQDKDKITPATEVHHVTPVETVTTIEQMETLMFEYSNLMSVCHECHKNIHAEMFSHSKENVKRANERRTKRFTDRYL
ncbi:HNH endonuclease signature motif containing protein [Parabacteroides timonensis]|uniref:HNH endonuclease signature motif containing protein n=1 Tax=Parabacteroides timonensis TaxID=1871013 RepID=UPI00094F0C9D|nr:HNH endonuclease signature motif containing protein [Parabacteroides timonensis]